MSEKALSEFTFIDKYAKLVKEEKRRETWEECVNRVRAMMKEKYKGKNVDSYIDEAYDGMLEKLVVGSQRANQFGGDPILRVNSRIFNCSFSYIDRPRVFQEIFYLLLCGAGVGYSVQKHHVEKLSLVSYRSAEEKVYVVEDSIEGWADAAGVLISSFLSVPVLGFEEYVGHKVVFDYNKIRAKGSMLSSGFKAPGYKPLQHALSKARQVLKKRVGKKLRPIDCHDIICHLSDAVLAGGHRRSACLSLFSLDDKEMMKCKTGDWFHNNPQRARANNSVAIIKGKTSYEEYAKIYESTLAYGEPGFMWLDDYEHGTNPCSEIGLYAYLHGDEVTKEDKLFCQTGKHTDNEGDWYSGIEMCNLSSINGNESVSKEIFLKQCRYAAIHGTLQAGFTNFPYLGGVTEKIVEKEALLGVSICGFMKNPDVLLDEEVLKEGAQIVRQVNEELAPLLGINKSARLTCVKPDGNTSSFFATPAGIHDIHSKRFFRNVQVNKSHAHAALFKKINPHAVEDSLWSATQSDYVFSFPIDFTDNLKVKKDFTSVEFLERVRKVQQTWVKEGTVKERCVKPWLHHNVSNTCIIWPGQEEEAAHFIFDNQIDFCGISFVPASCDLDYAQAPYTEVHTETEILDEYGIGPDHGLKLALGGGDCYGNLWVACDTLLGLRDARSDDERVWLAAANTLLFSLQTFWKNGVADTKKFTYYLKDSYNWFRWQQITENWVDPDYSQVIEDEENRDLMGENACGGGACLL